MSNNSKSKITSRSSSCSSNNGGMSSIGTWTISPRAGLEAQVIASISPVSSAKEACSWLEKKGWKLSSEPYSKKKLTNILFLAALAYKISAEVNTAIHTVAYLVRKLSKEELSTQIADKVIDKISDNLKEPIIKLTDSVSTTKSFLDATSQKQGAKLLSLQETVKQQCDNAKLIANSSAKLSTA
jgi:arsenate reductase-like glutaredoxin family protein